MVQILKKLFYPILFIHMLVLIGSCSEDGPPIIIPPKPLPGIPTIDAVMSAFMVANQTMDYSSLRDLLHSDFQMKLLPSTTRDFPNIGASWGLAAELGIARRLFSGEPIVESNGSLVPGVSSIEIQVFEQLIDWSEVALGLDFEGSQAAGFNIKIEYVMGGGPTLIVEGEVVFYVTDYEEEIDGVSYTFWQVVGIKDLTINQSKSTSRITWGALKAKFWVNE